MIRLAFCCALLAAAPAAGQTRTYAGPYPAKPDVPYLLHASTLLETETAEAKEEKRKDQTAFVITGAASPARTPLAEPIFLLKAEKLAPEKLELYRLESKGGRREVVLSEKKRRDATRPLRLSITRLGEGLFRIEAAEGLDNGEYSLTPAGTNQVFCFQVY